MFEIIKEKPQSELLFDVIDEDPEVIPMPPVDSLEKATQYTDGLYADLEALVGGLDMMDRGQYSPSAVRAAESVVDSLQTVSIEAFYGYELGTLPSLGLEASPGERNFYEKTKALVLRFLHFIKDLVIRIGRAIANFVGGLERSVRSAQSRVEKARKYLNDAKTSEPITFAPPANANLMLGIQASLLGKYREAGLLQPNDFNIVKAISGAATTTSSSYSTARAKQVVETLSKAILGSGMGWFTTEVKDGNTVHSPSKDVPTVTQLTLTIPPYDAEKDGGAVAAVKAMVAGMKTEDFTPATAPSNGTVSLEFEPRAISLTLGNMASFAGNCKAWINGYQAVFVDSTQAIGSAVDGLQKDASREASLASSLNDDSANSARERSGLIYDRLSILQSAESAIGMYHKLFTARARTIRLLALSIGAYADAVVKGSSKAGSAKQKEEKKR